MITKMLALLLNNTYLMGFFTEGRYEILKDINMRLSGFRRYPHHLLQVHKVCVHPIHHEVGNYPPGYNCHGGGRSVFLFVLVAPPPPSPSKSTSTLMLLLTSISTYQTAQLSSTSIPQMEDSNTIRSPAVL